MRTVNAFLETMIEMPAPLRFYFEGLRYGVLDIETTGLYSQRNKLILGGLLYEDEARGGVVLQQFLPSNAPRRPRLYGLTSRR